MCENRFLLPGDEYDDAERIKRLVQERRDWSMSEERADYPDNCCTCDVEPAYDDAEKSSTTVPDEMVMCFLETPLLPPDKGTIVYNVREFTNHAKTCQNQWYDIINAFGDDAYFRCRITEHIPVTFIPRSIVEDLPYVKQAVVGIFIQSESRIFLMKCLEGGMAGHYTMLEGHVAIPMENVQKDLLKINRDKLCDILYENAVRELNEEIHIECGARVLVDASSIRLTPKWFTHKNEVPGGSDISAKHVGFIYSMWIPDRLFDSISIKSNESCNELYCIEKSSIDNDFISRCDIWLQEILNSIIVN